MSSPFCPFGVKYHFESILGQVINVGRDGTVGYPLICNLWLKGRGSFHWLKTAIALLFLCNKSKISTNPKTISTTKNKKEQQEQRYSPIQGQLHRCNGRAIGPPVRKQCSAVRPFWWYWSSWWSWLFWWSWWSCWWACWPGTCRWPWTRGRRIQAWGRRKGSASLPSPPARVCTIFFIFLCAQERSEGFGFDFEDWLLKSSLTTYPKDWV